MDMLVLFGSPPSPYTRMVRIAASVLGLSERLTLTPVDLSNPADPLWQHNPLGKVPVLLLEDGTALFDSRVIVEYLDHLSGGGRLLPAGDDRFRVLRLQALAIGLLDAALLQVYEGRYRPAERHHQGWLDMQNRKVGNGLAALELSPPGLSSPPDAGQIALACALGYLDLRFHGRWRVEHPRLGAWLARFEESVPAYRLTHIDP